MSDKRPRSARGGNLPARPITVAVRERTARALGILYAVLAVAWVPLVVWSFSRDAGPLVIVWVVLAIATALLSWFSLSAGGGSVTIGPEGVTRSGLAGWKLSSTDVTDVRAVELDADRWVIRVAYIPEASKARGITLASGLSYRIDPLRGGRHMVSLPVRKDAVDQARAALTAETESN